MMITDFVITITITIIIIIIIAIFQLVVAYWNLIYWTNLLSDLMFL
jgi:hypothetical protein